LAYIYVDGENFNRQLLANGYARLYDSRFSLRDEFAATEATAREDGVGLWGLDEASLRSSTG
jgi:micrococcal nuclease